MKKPQCSCCLKEVEADEFIKEGGLCKECSKQIDNILKKEGIDGVRKFWKQKREEAAREQ